MDAFVNADQKGLLGDILRKPLDGYTLAPGFVGVLLGFATWVTPIDSSALPAGAAILGLLSVGLYFHRLILGWERYTGEIVAERRQVIEANRERELDRLEADLAADGDPRTERLLGDLRTLTHALMADASTPLGADHLDIASDVDRMFGKSVEYLRESLSLWTMADGVGQPGIKERLLANRELLIREVETSLENLGEVLGRVRLARVASPMGGDLAELREELSARLRIAEEVDRRIHSMRESVRSDEAYWQAGEP